MRICHCLYAPFVDEPRPWTTASGSPEIVTTCTTCSCVQPLCVLNVTCVPPLKSMPRFIPRTPSEITPARMIAPEIANQILRLLMKSIWSHFAVWLAAPRP